MLRGLEIKRFRGLEIWQSKGSNLQTSKRLPLRLRRRFGGRSRGLGLGDLRLALRGEIGLRLGLGGLLRGARSGLHVGGNGALLDSRTLRTGGGLRDGLRLALRTSGLLGCIALRTLGLTLAILLGGLRAVLVVRTLDDLREAVQDQLDTTDGIVVAQRRRAARPCQRRPSGSSRAS